MNDAESETDLRAAIVRVAELGRRAPVDPGHKSRLRGELMRRHFDLTAAGRIQQPEGLWSRFRKLKRLTLVAPPAAAAGIVVSIVFWLVPIISGHQTPQAVEAARITSALGRTAPTVTHWRWTLRQTVNGRTTTAPWEYGFSAYQRLYVRYNRAYLYSNGRWYLAPAAPLGSREPQTRASAWQWAFANLPARLARHDFTLLPARSVDGHTVEGFRYTLQSSANVQTRATAWVDRRSGLVVRLERLITRGRRVIERDVADYRYKTTK